MIEQFTGEFTWKFRVSGEHSTPVRDGYHTREIHPEQVAIRWYPESTFGQGAIQWKAKVTGPVVKRDGTKSTVQAEHEWGSWVRHYGEPPAVVAEIVEATRERAERAIRDA